MNEVKVPQTVKADLCLCVYVVIRLVLCSQRKRHYWRLDSKSLTLFQNESGAKFYKVGERARDRIWFQPLGQTKQRHWREERRGGSRDINAHHSLIIHRNYSDQVWMFAGRCNRPLRTNVRNEKFQTRVTVFCRGFWTCNVKFYDFISLKTPKKLSSSAANRKQFCRIIAMLNSYIYLVFFGWFLYGHVRNCSNV